MRVVARPPCGAAVRVARGSVDCGGAVRVASAAPKKVVPEMGGMGKLCLPVRLRYSTGKLRLPMAPEKLNDLTGNGTRN